MPGSRAAARTSRWLPVGVVALMVVVSTGAAATGADHPGSGPALDGSVTTTPAGAIPLHPPAATAHAEARSASTSPHLTYYGGPVVSHAAVRSVLWGSAGTYLAEERGTVSPNLDTFFTEITSSAYVTRLSEYNTPGSSGQHIGAGTFAGRDTITPSLAASATTLQDSTIRSELLAQINAGHLPAPAIDAGGQPDTVYALFFPAGVKVCTQGSCSETDICAYHGSFAATVGGHTRHVRYMVLPYPSAGIVSGCSSAVADTALKVLQSYTSHELTEAITDPDVSLASGLASPIGWYDEANGEIADICVGVAGTDATLPGSDGHQYVVQKTWSNSLNGCTVTGGSGSRDSSAPTVRTIAPSSLFLTGTTVTSRYTATDAGSGVASYDVQYRRAPWNGTFGPFVTMRSKTTATRVSFNGTPGTEYCLRVRARDHAGNVSGWTHPHCAVVPLDDRALVRSSTLWQRATAASAFRDTITRSSAPGSTLRLSGARGDQVAIIATTCQTCGDVAVYLNGTRWRVLDTSSATRRARVLFVLPRTQLATLSVTLKVAADHRPVLIDAIGIARP